MSSADDDSSCLVARAVPLPTRAQIGEPALDSVDSKKDGKKNSDASTDSLVNNFQKLSVNGNSASQTTTTAAKKPLRVADPADFVTLQSLRSSALARKTNTTSKFGRDGANLFADLLLNEKESKPSQTSTIKKPVEKPLDKKTTEDDKKTDEKLVKEKESASVEKNEKENAKAKKDEANSDENEDYLLSRGPVRAARSNITFHPYTGSKPYYPNSNESFDQACAPFGHPAALNNQYDYGQWNSNREVLSSSSTPDTVSSDLGYSSSSTSPHQQQSTSSAYPSKSGCSTVLPKNEDGELPDALSDFILKYSRSYRGSHSVTDSDDNSSTILSPKSGRPSSVESNLCDSPLSAGSAPESSPAAPHGGMSGPSTPMSDCRAYSKMGPLRTQLPSGQYSAYVGRQSGGQHLEQHSRPAKEVLRRLISSEEMDDAWAWTCKCMQNYPGALNYQDKDKDTLLHIVITHLDLGKIYALVEQMLKTEYPGHQKPFDMKNRFNETPLFLAIKQRHNEVVDYLLEAGADPNCQNLRDDRDGPLHYAAGHGMAEIVKTICSYNTTNLNMPNGKGLTPLLCAIKNHGSYEEEGGYIVDNTQTIQYLLKFGADPLAVDATNGQNAMHYAIGRASPEIIDVFKENLDEEVMTTLVNQADNNKETPLSHVQALVNTDENIRFKLCLSLIMCGANNNGVNVEQLI